MLGRFAAQVALLIAIGVVALNPVHVVAQQPPTQTESNEAQPTTTKSRLTSTLFPFRFGKKEPAPTDPFLQGVNEQKQLANQLIREAKGNTAVVIPNTSPITSPLTSTNQPLTQAQIDLPSRPYPWPAPVDSADRAIISTYGNQPAATTVPAQSHMTTPTQGLSHQSPAAFLPQPTYTYPSTNQTAIGTGPNVIQSNTAVPNPLPQNAAGSATRIPAPTESPATASTNQSQYYSQSKFFDPEHQPNHDEAFRSSADRQSSRRGWQPDPVATSTQPSTVAQVAHTQPLTTPSAPPAEPNILPPAKQAALPIATPTQTVATPVATVPPPIAAPPPSHNVAAQIQATPTPTTNQTVAPVQYQAPVTAPAGSGTRSSGNGSSGNGGSGTRNSEFDPGVYGSPTAVSQASAQTSTQTATPPPTSIESSIYATPPTNVAPSVPTATQSTYVPSIPADVPAYAPGFTQTPTDTDSKSFVAEDNFSTDEIEQDIWGPNLRNSVPGKPYRPNQPRPQPSQAPPTQQQTVNAAPPQGIPGERAEIPPVTVDRTLDKLQPFSGKNQPTNPKAPLFGAANMPTPDGVTDNDVDVASRVIAVVGDQSVLAGDLLWQINMELAPAIGKAPEDQINAERERRVRQRLPRMIENKLVYLDFLRTIPRDKLPELEEKVAEEFSKTRVPELMKDAKVESPSELDTMLRKAGSSLMQQQQIFMEQAVGQQMVHQNVRTQKEITHEQMLRYYYANSKDYEYPARARWEQLMVKWSSYPTKDAARAALADMGNQVLKGAPFDEVARTHSDGPNAEKGGAYDWTTKGSLRSEQINQVLFGIPKVNSGLPKDSLSKIIEFEDGACIVRVIQRERAGRKKFDDVQNDIKQELVKNHFKDELLAYLDRLKLETRIWSIYDPTPPQPVINSPAEMIASPPLPTQRR